MKSTSLSLSDKIDPIARAIYQNVHEAAKTVGAPSGAILLDILLRY